MESANKPFSPGLLTKCIGIDVSEGSIGEGECRMVCIQSEFDYIVLTPGGVPTRRWRSLEAAPEHSGFSI